MEIILRPTLIIIQLIFILSDGPFYSALWLSNLRFTSVASLRIDSFSLEFRLDVIVWILRKGSNWLALHFHIGGFVFVVPKLS